MGEVESFYRKGDVVFVKVGEAFFRFEVVGHKIKDGELIIRGANSNFAAAFKASQIVAKDNPFFPKEMPEAG